MVQVSFIVFKNALGTEQDGSTIVVTLTVKGKYVYFHYFKILFSPLRRQREEKTGSYLLPPCLKITFALKF